MGLLYHMGGRGPRPGPRGCHSSPTHGHFPALHQGAAAWWLTGGGCKSSPLASFRGPTIPEFRSTFFCAGRVSRVQPPLGPDSTPHPHLRMVIIELVLGLQQEPPPGLRVGRAKGERPPPQCAASSAASMLPCTSSSGARSPSAAPASGTSCGSLRGTGAPSPTPATCR